MKKQDTKTKDSKPPT